MTRPAEPITCDPAHVDRPHRALGMCLPCYFAHWRRVTRERRERIERRLAEMARMAS